VSIYSLMACTCNVPSTVTFVAKYKSVISVLSKPKYKEMCSRKRNSTHTHTITDESIMHWLPFIRVVSELSDQGANVLKKDIILAVPIASSLMTLIDN